MARRGTVMDYTNIGTQEVGGILPNHEEKVVVKSLTKCTTCKAALTDMRSKLCKICRAEKIMATQRIYKRKFKYPWE